MAAGQSTSGPGKGKLTVDLRRRTVQVNGSPLHLTPREFGILELLYRRSVLGEAETVVEVGRLRVNLTTRTVSLEGQVVPLSEKEYGILELLCLKRDQTVTKEMILDHLYGEAEYPGTKVIDVFLCKLRKKLALASGGANYVETVRGRGFVLSDPDGRRTLQRGRVAGGRS